MFCNNLPTGKPFTITSRLLLIAGVILIILIVESSALWPMPCSQTPGQGSTGQQQAGQAQIPTEVVVVTAPRVDIPLNETPAATTVIPAEVLKSMPRGIGPEEALKAVPGVKVDN